MSEPKNKQNDSTGNEEKKGLKPDPKTLHTTDPQEHMKGPLSSAVQNVKEEVEEGDKESKEEADQKKEENM